MCVFLYKVDKCMLFYSDCWYYQKLKLMARCPYKKKFYPLYESGDFFWCKGAIISKFKKFLNNLFLSLNLTKVSLKNCWLGEKLKNDLSNYKIVDINDFILHCQRNYNGYLLTTKIDDDSILYIIIIPYTSKQYYLINVQYNIESGVYLVNIKMERYNEYKKL